MRISSPSETVDESLSASARELLHESRPSGTYELEWDGRDAHGGPLGQGVYFLRYRVGSTSATSKITVVR